MKQFVIGSLMAFALAFAPSMTTDAYAQGNTQESSSILIPISGSGAGSTFTGTFDLQRFVVRDGDLFAAGTLTGQVTDTATGLVTSIVRNVLLPVDVGQATCDILHLELGPLDLDLLGLVVHLDKIVLDIDAQSGPGNLLGNLLCSVAGLLDNPTGLAGLLNDILAILG